MGWWCGSSIIGWKAWPELNPFIAWSPRYSIPKKAPAPDLAALYHERWEIETALDELKTHLRGARIVLRSKRPELVRQEFYGLMMAHFRRSGV